MWIQGPPHSGGKRSSEGARIALTEGLIGQGADACLSSKRHSLTPFRSTLIFSSSTSAIGSCAARQLSSQGVPIPAVPLTTHKRTCAPLICGSCAKRIVEFGSPGVGPSRKGGRLSPAAPSR
jgi:hypothetical protein